MIWLDTEYDFIQPEFLNILFFEQKNLVIFPYVDLKHLHALELFTVGYNAINLESTILHNLKEIIEFDSSRSYSANKSFYFIYNLNREKIMEILQLSEIRCVLNTNKNVSKLAGGRLFIFYNKKNNTFINYDFKEIDLEFEKNLISTSKNETILYEKIQEIKIVASKIFAEVNQNPTLRDNSAIIKILQKYDSRYWSKILKFVELFYEIKIPGINVKLYSSKSKSSSKKEGVDYSNEYDAIILQNLNITKEFVQILHDYRSNKVNPSNLELEQLRNPQKLYNYLRNHHWKGGIPVEFLSEWVKMQKMGRILSGDDIDDFKVIFDKLGVDKDMDFGKAENRAVVKGTIADEIPSIQDFRRFKEFLIKRMDMIERLIKKRN